MAKEFALADGEVHVVEDEQIAEAFGQVLYFNLDRPGVLWSWRFSFWMALLPAAGSVFEIKDAEVVFLHILFDAPHGPGALRDDEGVAGLHQRLAALRVFNLGGAFGNDAQLRARMAGKFKRPRPAVPHAACIFPEGWTTFRQTLVSGSPSEHVQGGRAHVPRLAPFPEKSVLCPLLLQFF